MNEIILYIVTALLIIFIVGKLIKQYQNSNNKNKDLLLNSKNKNLQTGHSKEEQIPNSDDSEVETNTDNNSTDNVSVVLKVVPNNSKIAVLKEVRYISFLGLKEAKELIEAAPVVIKKTSKAEAYEIKKRLEAAGATVEIK